MDFKRIFKRGKHKKDGSKSQGGPLRPEPPSPNTSIHSTRLNPGSPEAVSALVFHPFAPIPIPLPNDVHTQPTATNLTKNTGSNLASFLDILNQTAVFAPLAEVIDNLNWFIQAHENLITTQVEYKALQTQFEAMFRDLCDHFSRDTPPAMTTSMLKLCDSIQSELREVYGTQDRGTISRHLQAGQNLDKITGCYQRIQSHLGRIIMNASLNIWRVVDKHAAEARLDKLNMSTSARYDSADAHVVQRRECTPNTRERVLFDLTAWKDNQNGEKVCWINGMAGTGKTTITNTLCSILDKSHELGASFFCTRSLPECRNVKFILPTVAYQLARFSGPFRGALLQVLERDPDVHTKVLPVQFKRMILEPLRSVIHSLPENIVIILDALDECEDGDGVGQILEVLLERASELPIKFLVSSRPERHIRQRIYQSTLRTQLVLHELDEKVVKTDIETYLRAELASIPTPPTQGQLAALVERAGTLFIYAATVVRYIKRGGSTNRLAAVLSEPDPRQQQSNKTKEIDRLYKTVLISAFEDEDLEQIEKDQMKLVLHTVVCAQEPLTADGLAGLLRLDCTQVIDALRPLWSVLHVSESDTNHRVSTLHASFADYILDSKRSVHFACNAPVHNGKLAELSLGRIGRNRPQFNVCDLPSAYVLDGGVANTDDKVKRAVPLDLLYACQYWAIHLELGGWSTKRAEMLPEFLAKRLLLWMEVLNLTKNIDKSIGIMEKVITWVQSTECSRGALPLVRDARRFVTMFATSPVSQSTPHLYISMLSSWPSDQPIAQFYTPRISDPVQLKGIAAAERQLSLLSLVPAESVVNCVAYAPDGTFFAAGTDNYTILIWDAVSCQMTIDPIRGHTAPIRAIAISLDGSQICSGAQDYTIRIWDRRSGHQVAGPLEGHTSWVRSLDYSPDGLWLSSGANDGTVRIWNTRTWQMKGIPLNAHAGRVVSVVFSPNGLFLAACSESLICLWDPSICRMTGETLKGHVDLVTALAFTPDGKYLISGSLDCTICIWSVSEGQMVFGPLREHLSGIENIVVSPNGSIFVSAASDNTIRIWDTTTWQSHSIFHQTGMARSVRFSPDGSRLVSGSVDRNIRVWEVPYLNEGQIFDSQSQGHASWVRSVAFSPCGTYVISGSEDMTVCIWDLKTKQLMRDPFKGEDQILSVGISADGNRIFSISEDRMVWVWELHNGQLEHTIGPLETDGDYDSWYLSFWPAAFLFDGRRVVCGSNSGRIYVWEDNMLSFKVAGHSSPVYSIAFSPDGQSFISGSDDGDLILWDLSNGATLHRFTGHNSGIYSVAFSADGSLVASGSMDYTICLWNTHTGLPEGDSLRGHTHGVRSVAFSPCGGLLISGSEDTSVRIWDVAGGIPIAIFHGHTAVVLSVAFSPDGSQAVSGSADMTVRVWHAPKLERPPTDNEYSVPSRYPASASKVDWTMDGDGWVRDSQYRLLLWVPPDLRSSLLRPQNTMLMSRRGCIELDFSNARVGDAWETCFRPL